MQRRQFLKQSGALGAFALGAMGMGCAGRLGTPGGSARPNILLILVDDAGWKDFGFHDSEVMTPNLNRLAAEGAVLDQYYVTPVCTATRASLMTGRPQSRGGLYTAIAADAGDPLDPDTRTLANVMNSAGYRTGMTGKWHLGNTLDRGPNHYGFEHGHGFLGPWIDQYAHTTQGGKTDWQRNGVYITQEGHSTDLITDEAISFLNAEDDRPFFLFVSYNCPHLPLQEEDRWLDLYKDSIDIESRRYWAAAVTHIDYGIGRIMETLRKNGFDRNTVILFSSDNGGETPGKKSYIFPIPTYRATADTTLYGINKPFRGAKYTHYEGGIRVGALAWAPGRIPAGTHVADPLIVYDVLPTFAALAGTTVPATMGVEGVNVWPVITGEARAPDRILYWRLTTKIAVRKGDWKLLHKGTDPDKGTDELYNIAEDPYETTDLAAARPDILANLRAELRAQAAKDAPDRYAK